VHLPGVVVRLVCLVARREVGWCRVVAIGIVAAGVGTSSEWTANAFDVAVAATVVVGVGIVVVEKQGQRGASEVGDDVSSVVLHDLGVGSEGGCV